MKDSRPYLLFSYYGMQRFENYLKMKGHLQKLLKTEFVLKGFVNWPNVLKITQIRLFLCPEEYQQAEMWVF